MPRKQTIACKILTRISVRFLVWFVAAGLIIPACAARANAQGLTDVAPLAEFETPTDDLIRLATGYADALRDYKVAKLSIETVQSLQPNSVVTNLEVQIASLNLEAAERKLRLLRAILEKQLEAAENQLEIIKYLEKIGVPPANNNAREPANAANNYLRAKAESTIQILKMILSMN